VTVLLGAWRDGDGTALEALIPLVHEFLAMSARLMRRVLVDPARSRRAVKRGGSAVRVTFDALAALDDRKSRVVEVRFFGVDRRRTRRRTPGLAENRAARLGLRPGHAAAGIDPRGWT
jgi:hypothetical protein